jgi:hypothetical protein
MNSTNPFQSFWMGGYECADHLNAFGNRVDLLQDTGHLQFLTEDYLRLRELNITTVREGIRWSVAEPHPYVYDWSAVDVIIDTARQTGIQVVWDICHFGFAPDLTPLHPMFARRFAYLCEAFARHYSSRVPEGELIITPINEVSFLSWLGGDVRGTAPYTVGQGWDVKYHLMKAYIEGIEALHRVDSSIRILTTEPLIYIASPDPDHPELTRRAQEAHEAQFQVLDMLSGRMCPELRGRPEYLDILGYNYYHDNQWIGGGAKDSLIWHPEFDNPARRTLDALLQEAWLRYERPFILSETSHFEDHRPEWLGLIAQEATHVLKSGLPLLGICLYPVLDRPDWDHPERWHRSGIWDIPNPETLDRILHLPTAAALHQAQQQVQAAFPEPEVLEAMA